MQSQHCNGYSFYSKYSFLRFNFIYSLSVGVSVRMCMYGWMDVYLCHMCAGVWGSKKRTFDSLASCRMPIMRSEPESLRRAPRALSKRADSPVPQIILVKKKINWRVDPDRPEVSFNLQSKNLRNLSLNKKPTASTIFFFSKWHHRWGNLFTGGTFSCGFLLGMQVSILW